MKPLETYLILFSQDNENLPGIVRKDGTVEIPPETDVVTNLAKEGERKVNWILMASMIVIFSALGIVAGIALDPMLAIVLLIGLALFGFWLRRIMDSQE